MVNVNKSNFVEQSNDLIEHLPTAAFVAIDEEMTGISIPGSGRPPKEQSPSQRYEVLKQAPERYSIIQLGVCLFHADTDATWKVRRYNFYMFPAGETSFRNRNTQEREIVLNPGAVAFLNQHHMSFDHWMKEGIPYQTCEQAKETMSKYLEIQMKILQEQKQQQQDQLAPATVQETVRRRVELTRTEDIAFYARSMANLREWLDAAHQGTYVNDTVSQGKSYLLPACNSFLRRAFYECIGKEYPSLDLENAGPEHPNQIRVWRLTSEEKTIRRKRLREEAWNQLMSQKIGMWRVVEALSRVCRGEALDPSSVLFAPSYDAIDWEKPGSILDVTCSVSSSLTTQRKIPLVVHNGFMDVCFLLTHFHQGLLPPTLPQCKSLIRKYFPLIYDTKVVCTECATAWTNEVSTLSNLYQKLVVNQDMSDRLHLVQGVAEQSQPDQEHEAAFDAYMTGSIYIALCNSIRVNRSNAANHHDDDDDDDVVVGSLTHLLDETDTKNRFVYGRNKFYQMSMYTMDLEEPLEDPLRRGMLPDTTYRVSGIDPSVSTRDIVRCLSVLMDSEGRRVNYEIIWVDDTTFLVAASYRPPPPAPAEEGEVVVSLLPAMEELTRVLHTHGRIVKEALRMRFQKESIMSLSDHLKAVGNATKAAEEPVKKSFFSRFLRFFRDPPAVEGTETGSRKRRRLN